jgi:hypothetical protein
LNLLVSGSMIRICVDNFWGFCRCCLCFFKDLLGWILSLTIFLKRNSLKSSRYRTIFPHTVLAFLSRKSNKKECYSSGSELVVLKSISYFLVICLESFCLDVSLLETVSCGFWFSLVDVYVFLDYFGALASSAFFILVWFSEIFILSSSVAFRRSSSYFLIWLTFSWYFIFQGVGLWFYL